MSPRLGSTPEHNEFPGRQRISNALRRKSHAINQLAFWGGAGSTPAASTISPDLVASRRGERGVQRKQVSIFLETFMPAPV
jgi:hypothetical protein